jgi:hypothetical protein
MASPYSTSPKAFSLSNALLTLAPFFLAVVAAYGASEFLQGRTSERLSNLEQQQKQMVTREELKLYMDLTRDDLREIKDNMRALRSDLGRSRSGN